MARISRISFGTDMTRPNAPEIPLGFMLEAVWPDEARWLGLIGRTRLSVAESALINIATWPELKKPFSLLDRMFDQGWGAQWGEAGTATAALWARSSMIMDTQQQDELLAQASIESESAWAAATALLERQLSLLGDQLNPSRSSWAFTQRPGDIAMRVAVLAEWERVRSHCRSWPKR